MNLKKRETINIMETKKFQYSEKLFLYVIFAIVVLVNILFVFEHTMWRDEAQAWLIARDTSFTPNSLFKVTSYEGHPFLWFFILMPFAKLGLPAVTVKYISAACMIAAAYIFIVKTELPLFIKIISVCSPMFFYEYWGAGRSYSLAALFMVVLIMIYDVRNEKPILYGTVLALLLQTLVIYGGFVFGCSLCWAIEIIKAIPKQDKSKTRGQIIGLSIVFISALLLLWEFRYVGSAISSQENVVSAGLSNKIQTLIYTGLVCCNNIFGEYYVLFIFAILFIGVGLVILTHDIEFLVVSVTGIIWQVWIYAFVYPHVSSNRLISWIYILIFLFGLLRKYEKPQLISNRVKIDTVFWTIAGIMIFMTARFQNMNALEEFNPEKTFSTSKEIAAVLNTLPSDSVIFISSSDYDSAVVAQIDNNHKIWSPFTSKEASFVLRDPQEEEILDYDQFIDVARSIAGNNKEVYLISQLDDTDCIAGLVEKSFEEDGSIERYYCSEKSPISGEYFYILKVYL